MTQTRGEGERAVDPCLEHLGALTVSEGTRAGLVSYAAQGDAVRLGPTGPDKRSRKRIGEVLQMAAGTPEFQRS